QNNFNRGGVAELAWRYNSDSRWQIGPIVDAYIGGGDRYGSTDPTWTSFGGLQIVKEIPFRGVNMFRVGVKGLTDLSIRNEDVKTVMLDFQWGFGASQPTSTITMQQPSEQPSTIGAANGVGSTITATSNPNRSTIWDAEASSLTIREQDRLQFDSGKSTLNSDNREFVQRIGTAVSERSDLYDTVEVVGFADQTGSPEVNQRVSEQRAQSVAAELRQNGLSDDQVTVSGRGSEEPLYQSLMPEDLQQNRRVDIIFHGVKDRAQLEEAISSTL
ncbi:MAG: OmpA family protein, partial [Proteobacteria bacterium]